VSLPIDPQQAFSKPTSRAPIDSASAEAGFESNSSYRDPTVDNSLPTLSTSDELQSDKPTQSVMTAMPPPKTNQQFKSIPNRQNSDRNDSFLVSTSSNGDKNDDNSDNNDNNGRGGWNPPSDSFQHSFTQRERDANDDDGTGLPSATMAATTRTTATLPFKSAFSSPPSTVQNAAGRTASPFDGPRTPFQATTRPSSLFASPPAPNQTSRTATSQNRGASDDFALPTQSTATTTNNNNDNVGQMPDDNNDNDQNTGTFAETFAPPRSTNGGSFLTNLTSTRQSFKSTPLSRLFNPAVVPDDRFVRPLADPLVKFRPKQSVPDMASDLFDRIVVNLRLQNEQLSKSESDMSPALSVRNNGDSDDDGHDDDDKDNAARNRVRNLERPQVLFVWPVQPTCQFADPSASAWSWARADPFNIQYFPDAVLNEAIVTAWDSYAGVFEHFVVWMPQQWFARCLLIHLSLETKALAEVSGVHFRYLHVECTPLVDRGWSLNAHSLVGIPQVQSPTLDDDELESKVTIAEQNLSWVMADRPWNVLPLYNTFENPEEADVGLLMRNLPIALKKVYIDEMHTWRCVCTMDLARWISSSNWIKMQQCLPLEEEEEEEATAAEGQATARGLSEAEPQPASVQSTLFDRGDLILDRNGQIVIVNADHSYIQEALSLLQQCWHKLNAHLIHMRQETESYVSVPPLILPVQQYLLASDIAWSLASMIPSASSYYDHFRYYFQVQAANRQDFSAVWEVSKHEHAWFGYFLKSCRQGAATAGRMVPISPCYTFSISLLDDVTNTGPADPLVIHRSVVGVVANAEFKNALDVHWSREAPSASMGVFSSTPAGQKGGPVPSVLPTQIRLWMTDVLSRMSPHVLLPIPQDTKRILSSTRSATMAEDAEEIELYFAAAPAILPDQLVYYGISTVPKARSIDVVHILSAESYSRAREGARSGHVPRFTNLEDGVHTNAELDLSFLWFGLAPSRACPWRRMPRLDLEKMSLQMQPLFKSEN
jgi:hypothetical protein